MNSQIILLLFIINYHSILDEFRIYIYIYRKNKNQILYSYYI
jgi:hypothetical protein